MLRATYKIIHVINNLVAGCRSYGVRLFLGGLAILASLNAYAVVPADENYDTNAGVSFTTDTFILDGIKYTIIGSHPGSYTTIVSNSIGLSPLGNNAGDYFIFFDSVGMYGISGIRVEAADGSAFWLSNLSFDAAADLNITVTPYNGGVAGTALNYSSNGALILQQNINVAANTAFQNITSFLISGGNLSLALDDLDFEPPLVADSTPPTVTSVTSSTSDGTYKVGDPISIQVNFSENVIVASGTPQLTLETGTTDRTINYTGGTNSSTLTFTYTVQAGDTTADLDYTTINALTLSGSTIRDAAGNNAILTLATPGAANSLGNNKALVIDGVVPTVTSVNSVTANGTYKIGDVISVQINFSKAVTVTGTPQLTLETGATDRTISYASGSGTSTLTFSYTVQAGDNSNDLDYVATTSLALGGGTIRDAAGNNATLTLATPGQPGSLGANKNFVIDGVVPSVTSTAPVGGSLSTDTSVDFTVNFSESVSNISTDDFALGVTGSATGTIASVSALSGTSVDVTVSGINGNGTIKLNVNASTNIADAAGNSGLAAYTSGTTHTVAIPLLTITIGTDKTALKAGETATLTFALSESSTNFILGDITATGGVVSNLNGSGTSYTATFTPTANSTTGATVDVAGGVFTNATGNGNTAATQLTMDVDTLAPDAPSRPVLASVSDSGIAGDNITNDTTPTFTGTAEAGSTVRLYKGSTVLGETMAIGGVWSITTTPLTEGSHSLTAKATDAAGNPSDVSEVLTIQIDTTAPTVSSVLMTDTNLIAGETSLVTFTFSKAVTDFANALTVSNGSLSQLNSADNGITWTATFTPAINTTALVNTISVAGASVTDIAGNAASGTAPSANYTIDTLRPVATIVVADTELNLGETSEVTITFNRAVSGFANDDLTITNGTLTAVSSQDGGITWSATFTPEADTDAPVNVITLDNSGVQDSAGNTGTGTTDSNEFAVHTVPRTLVVTSLLDIGDDGSIGNSLEEDKADGDGLSLREALHWARNSDSITFDEGGTIVLGGNALAVKVSNLKIAGDLDQDGVADLTISGNNASRVMVIYNDLDGIELTGLTLTQGADIGGDGGGGIHIGSDSNLTLRNSNVTNSSATSFGGGGIFGSNVSITLINTTVRDNTSNTFGGGIHAMGPSTLNVINSTISGNTTTGRAAHGGAIQFEGQTLTVINSTISGNAALGVNSEGGGLSIASGTSYIYNSTIVGNAAGGAAGGVSANGIENFFNTVIAGNTSGADAAPATGGSSLATGGIADDVIGTIEIATHNYFGTEATISAGNNNLNNQGTAALLLGILGNNGGMVQTHLPQSGSALIDAGSNAALPLDIYDLNNNGDITEALPSDANGNIRVRNIVDIGAVEGNSKPVISGAPATSVNENAAYSFTPTALDAEGETLTFSITNKPIWATFNATSGELIGTPTNADVGVVTGIIITVSDGNSSVSLPAFNVTVVNVNDAPTISGTPATSVNQDVLYSFVPAAADIDAGDVLTFGITNQPTWASFDTATGALTGTPAKADVGVTSGIVISVSDGELSASLPAFDLTVASVNTVPVISGTPLTTIEPGNAYNFIPTASDPDGEALTFSITGKPSWAAFNTATGRLSGTPAATDKGTYGSIRISVSDGQLNASLPAFTLTVSEAVDPSIPVVTAPAPVTLNASALYTPVTLRQLLKLETDAGAEALQAALAALTTGGGDACCTTLPEGLNDNAVLLLSPGRHEVVWTAVAGNGKTASVKQTVNIRPLVSFGKHQQALRDGVATVRILLNGVSPVYPLAIPVVIDTATTAAETEYTLLETVVMFNDAGQTEAHLEVQLHTAAGMADSELVLGLDDRSSNPAVITGDLFDINSGAANRHVISLREGNIAPEVSLTLNQDKRNTILVARTGGDVTVTAQVTDLNPTDTHSFDWSGTDNVLADVDGNIANNTLVFSPAALTGRYYVQLTVTDSAGATETADLYFRVVEQLPVLDPNKDSNGNGIDDATEGFGDANGNGIPDYRDAMPTDNVLPQDISVTGSYLLECEPGVLCRIGRFALMAEGGAQLLDSDLQAQPDLGVDNGYEPVGGIFDFEVRHLPLAGQTIQIVLPQQAAIPADAVYRKFRDGAWTDFVANDNNQLHSAPGNPGFCPPPGDAQWQPGLVAGYLCVQLTLEDGGPNDADGLVNKAIADPGGVSVRVHTEPPVDPEPPVNPEPPVKPESPVNPPKEGKKSSGAFGLMETGAALLLLLLAHNRRRAMTKEQNRSNR